MLLPLYQDHDRTYRADTCSALVAAQQRSLVRLEALVRGHYPGRRLPSGALPGVKSVGFWDARGPQDWGLDWHRNEGVEFTLLERGSVAFEVDGHPCHLRPDDLTVTRPWQRHRVGDPHVGPGRLHWLILDVGVRRPHQPWRWPAWVVLTPADRAELTDYLRHCESPVWQATPEVAECFQRLARSVERDAGGDQISRLAALLNELLVLVLEMFRSRRVNLDASLASAERTVELFWAELQRIPEHLAEPWTVVSMARQCGLGPTRFIHYTKLLTNATPITHLARCRLAEAARQLRSRPERSILDVALAVGYSSSQYFATAFRREFGCAPSEYLHRIQPHPNKPSAGRSRPAGTHVCR